MSRTFDRMEHLATLMALVFLYHSCSLESCWKILASLKIFNFIYKHISVLSTVTKHKILTLGYLCHVSFFLNGQSFHATFDTKLGSFDGKLAATFMAEPRKARRQCGRVPPRLVKRGLRAAGAQLTLGFPRRASTGRVRIT